jgi:hypothetical protein
VKKARRLQNFALWEGAARMVGLSAGDAFSDEVRRGSNFPPRPAGNCCLKNRRLTSSRLLGKLCSDEVVDALMGVPTTSCRRVSQTTFRRGQTRSDEVGCSPAGNGIKPYIAAHFSTCTGSFPAVRTRPRVYKRQFSNRIACARTRIQTTTFRSSTRTRRAHVYASATFRNISYTPRARARPYTPARPPSLQNPTHRARITRATCAYR